MSADDQDVTLYSKPGCVQCTATERQFDRDGTDYTKVDVTTDSAALDHVKDLGYSAAPVVEVTSADPEQRGHWSGFRPDKIATIGTDHVATAQPPTSLVERVNQLADRAPVSREPVTSRAGDDRQHLANLGADLATTSPGMSR